MLNSKFRGVEYEASVDSESRSWEKHKDEETQEGTYLFMSLNLGKIGDQTIECQSNDDPFMVAKSFCKQFKLGPKTIQTVANMIEKRQKQYYEYS